VIVVPDTSAWVEFFRDSDHPVAAAVSSVLEGSDDVLLTDCVYMEILAGARSQTELDQLTDTFSRFPVIRLGAKDFVRAAKIYRDCRAAGSTLRSQIDCLIAVPAMNAGAQILHNDKDFDAIARNSSLRIYPWDSN
jgi:hypothetical protein